MLITHELRFQRPGAYAKFTVAGFPFFIVRDRQGQLNAFLNICRHRAFPVVLQDEGTASILACKYHGKHSPLISVQCKVTHEGWSYGLSGNLAKAPKFDSVEGFDKAQHGLYRVHLKIDARGQVWINLDSAEVPEVSWDESFHEVDQQQRLRSFDMKNYRYDHSWQMDGDYNWKTLIDNYNEVRDSESAPTSY